MQVDDARGSSFCKYVFSVYILGYVQYHICIGSIKGHRDNTTKNVFTENMSFFNECFQIKHECFKLEIMHINVSLKTSFMNSFYLIGQW